LFELSQSHPELCRIRDNYILYSKPPTPEEIEWKDLVLDFRELKDHEKKGAPFGYFFRGPNVITFKYMKYLMGIADRLGVQFFRYNISSVQKLFEDWKGDVYVNCLGTGAFKVFNDKEIFPIRGVLVHLKEKLRLNRFVCWDDCPDGLTYVISREDKCILGGTHDKGNWSRTPTKEEIDGIYQRCLKMEPELKGAEIIGTWVGLRPGRTSVRIELDNSFGKPVIHNTGHGGSGITMHWGTAQEVIKILTDNFPTHSFSPKL